VATDPGVTRRKFDREIAKFRSEERHYREQGIWMLDSEYPEVLVAFASASSPQVFVPFGALINFEDYDAIPLKVTLVHPCSRRPLKFHEVLTQVMNIPEKQAQAQGRLLRVRQDASSPAGIVADSILQGYDSDPEFEPFLCIAGVRAYHEHPAHSGDSWWLYRGTGRGTLHQILHLLWEHGPKNIVQPWLKNTTSHVGYLLQADVANPLTHS
jgi:hypothetical protein